MLTNVVMLIRYTQKSTFCQQIKICQLRNSKRLRASFRLTSMSSSFLKATLVPSRWATLKVNDCSAVLLGERQWDF